MCYYLSNLLMRSKSSLDHGTVKSRSFQGQLITIDLPLANLGEGPPAGSHSSNCYCLLLDYEANDFII